MGVQGQFYDLGTRTFRERFEFDPEIRNLRQPDLKGQGGSGSSKTMICIIGPGVSFSFPQRGAGRERSCKVGWKHGALIERLESQRKARGLLFLGVLRGVLRVLFGCIGFKGLSEGSRVHPAKLQDVGSVDGIIAM